MNERKHWDKIAPTYNDEIFDVFKSDREGKLQVLLARHANADHSAIDFGCGTGKAFPMLSPAFRELVAVDISAGCIRTARQRPYENVTFRRADLSVKNIQLPKVDFAFCCNVIMLPELEKNELMFRNLRKALKKMGTALIVVPSLDSMMYAMWRMIEWYKTEGVGAEKIPSEELDYVKGSKTSLLQGIIRIDGVPTKHYTGSELEVITKRAGLRMTALEKLTYDWDSEFANPPRWMKDPYPWDWLIECEAV